MAANKSPADTLKSLAQEQTNLIRDIKKHLVTETRLGALHDGFSIVVLVCFLTYGLVNGSIPV